MTSGSSLTLRRARYWPSAWLAGFQAESWELSREEVWRWYGENSKDEEYDEVTGST